MNSDAERIQAVMDTLQQLDMKPSFDNMNKLLGCLQVLADVRDNLQKGDNKNGTADTQ